MSQGHATPVQYDPYAYDIHEDPYPTYARLRDEAPVYRNEQRGFWALSRHADVTSGFRNTSHLSNSYGVSIDPSSFGPEADRVMSFLAMDPPRHTRMRALVAKGFTPRRVAGLEPRIREIAVSHLEPLLDRGEFDFVADLAGLIPMDVISEMLGVPPADRAEVRRLADLLVHRDEGVLDVPKAGIDAAFALAAYFADMIRERRAQPAEDLTSAVLAADIDGDRLSDDDVISFLFLMVVAGNETTTKLLTNAWYWSGLFPATKSALFATTGTDNGSRVGNWIEETLRFDTSTQMLARIAVADIELHGTTIPSGSPVLLLIGSANRDPRVFPDPDGYDIDRDTSGLVSFGVGRHFCMGAALARLEARVALGLLIDKVADYEIDESRAVRVHSINVRGFAHLPSTVKPR